MAKDMTKEIDVALLSVTLAETELAQAIAARGEVARWVLVRSAVKNLKEALTDLEKLIS